MTILSPDAFQHAPTTRALLVEIGERSDYRHANDANCATPDAPTSPGAKFLDLVACAMAEAFTYEYDATDPADVTADELRDWFADAVHEVADGCVPVYTHDIWTTFTDLAAYREDPEELTSRKSSMEDRASICLYLIAERLCSGLIGEIAEAWEEDADA